MEGATATISCLKAIRTSRGMVLQQLAALADVSVTTIVSIEKWNHRATLETYQKLAKALDVEVHELQTAVNDN